MREAKPDALAVKALQSTLSSILGIHTVAGQNQLLEVAL